MTALQQGLERQDLLHSLEYEARLDLLIPTCVAWSPVIQSPATAGFAMLAVGTRAGWVWLWKYTLPALACQPPSKCEAESLQLVRDLLFGCI